MSEASFVSWFFDLSVATETESPVAQASLELTLQSKDDLELLLLLHPPPKCQDQRRLASLLPASHLLQLVTQSS